MSRTSKRDPPPADTSADRRLARLLDSPLLARAVPYLSPETLHQLIQHRGLDACGEIVTSATPAQLTSLLDLDLWRQSQPGRDHEFDVGRFGEWIEVLVDTGSATAARTVAALDRDVVVAGLSRLIRVFDPGIFEPTAQSDDEATDRHEAMREGDLAEAGSDGLECELGGYLVRARRPDVWDAVIALLIALDTEDSPCFHAVMQGCRNLSNSRPESDGLDELLLAPEQHLHDVTLERERRRSQQGYAMPGDARAFLEMARQPKPAEPNVGAAGPTTSNPIVAAYFRAVAETPEPSSGAPGSTEPATELRAPDDEVVQLLNDAGVIPQGPRALLEGEGPDPQGARLAHIRRLMAHVRDTDEAAYLTRCHELAFIANTLLEGCSVQSRPLTAVEASDAAVAICNLGLEQSQTAKMPAPEAALIDHDLVTAFEAGWSVLYRDVSLVVAGHLASMLTDLECLDSDVQQGLEALRRSLTAEIDAGTPWLARDAAEVLAQLDVTAWIAVLGLLDECPVVPAALTAILEGRTTAVSATAFDFISTTEQIGDIRLFLRKLPHLLSR
jgi:hypothetical protein